MTSSSTRKKTCIEAQSLTNVIQHGCTRRRDSHHHRYVFDSHSDRMWKQSSRLSSLLIDLKQWFLDMSCELQMWAESQILMFSLRIPKACTLNANFNDAEHQQSFKRCINARKGRQNEGNQKHSQSCGK